MQLFVILIVLISTCLNFNEEQPIYGSEFTLLILLAQDKSRDMTVNDVTDTYKINYNHGGG